MSGLVNFASGAIAEGGFISDFLFGEGGPVVLGSVTFDGHEVPAQITWGGRQSLAVHKMPGGQRIIDAMGRDDAEISWAGTFFSQDAGDRAFQVDAMRIAGLPVPLIWGSHYYLVVIADFAPSDQQPTIIPYKINCTVVQDMSQPPSSSFLTAILAVYQDVNEAIGYVSGILGAFQGPNDALSAALAAVNGAAPTGLILGASTSLAAIAAIRAAYAAVTSAQQAADSQIEAVALTALSNSIVNSTAALATASAQAGASAQMAAAAGYVGRAQTNAENGAT